MSISAGALSSFAIDREGKVWATGYNVNGQLGLGDINQREYFTPIEDLPPIIMVSAGVEHTLFLDQDGHVWGTGSNSHNQLGFDDSPNIATTGRGGLSNANRTSPEMIPNLEFIVSIAAGENTSLFLDNQGRVWESGITTYPLQLNVPFITAISAGPKASVLIDIEGGVWINKLSRRIVQDETGNNVYLREYERELGIPPMKAASVNSLHILLLDREGKIWSRGLNNYGQVGRVTYKGWKEDFTTFEPIVLNSKIAKISAGGVHSLALDENGQLWVFGSNKEGELGLAEIRPRVIPEEHPLINTFNVVLVDISAGSYHSLALDHEGNLLVFGQDSEGQLGLGYFENVSTPMLIPNIRGRVLDEPLDPELFTPAIISEYDIIKYLQDHDRIADFTIQRNLGEDSILQFVDTEGQEYISQVRYHPPTDKFSKPIQPQIYYNFFVALGNTDQLLDYHVRDDINFPDQDNKAVKALEFISKLGQRYLISVIHAPSQTE